MRDAQGNHVSIRDYVDRIFEENEKALAVAFRGQQEALSIASRNIDDKLAELNRLRQEVITDRGQMVTRDKYDAAVDEIRAWQDRADGALNVARFLGGAGVLALIVELARAAGWLK